MCGALYVPSFVSYFVFYEWLRYFGARQPNSETGEIFARKLQQPFDVYLTRTECAWLDWGMVPVAVLAGFFFWVARQRKNARKQ